MSLADIISFAAASTGMSSAMMALRATKKKNPVVGFGVQGRNTETCSSWLGRRDTISLLGRWDRNTSDHMPGAGNSTRPTVRKLDPDSENRGSNTCFQPL